MSAPAPRSSILRTTLLVLPAQIAFRGLEAILPLLLAYWFGRNDATDVYYFAWAVFAFAGSLVFGAFHDSAIVPILAEERIARPKELPRLLGSLLVHTWAVGGAIGTVVGAIALGWFRFRYDAPHFAIAARMVVPFSLYLVAMSTRTFFSTLLVVERRFFVQPLASAGGMIVNVAILATLNDAVGVALVPAAALVGELVAASLLALYTTRLAAIRIRLCFERPPALIAFARLAASEVGGGAVTRLNPVVDQLMAGLAGVVGGGTVLRYSGDVSSLPTSLLQAALLPILLSHLAEDFARRDLATIRRTVVRALAAVTAILVAMAALLFALRAPILRFVFLRGEMDVAGVDRMIAILPYHLVGLAPFGALLVLARANVATKNSAIMVGMGVLNASLNVVLNVLLVRVLGLDGIALATSLVHLIVAIVFWFRFEARLAQLRGGPARTPEREAA